VRGELAKKEMVKSKLSKSLKIFLAIFYCAALRNDKGEINNKKNSPFTFTYFTLNKITLISGYFQSIYVRFAEFLFRITQ